MTATDALYDYLLRLGDNALILSQRLGEWSGKAPALEEDMATANVALDLLGQARLWLSYAAEIAGGGISEDTLAFLRDAPAFRNLLLVEQPNGNYAETMARQFYFDRWHLLLLNALSASRDARVAAIAAKGAKEVAYHAERSAGWIVRLGDGTELSHQRMQAAIDDLWPFSGEMFAMDALEEGLARDGIAADVAALFEPWLEAVRATLEEAGLVLPEGRWMQSGGKQGRHTEKLGYILAEMQFLPRAYPGATW